MVLVGSVVPLLQKDEPHVSVLALKAALNLDMRLHMDDSHYSLAVVIRRPCGFRLS